MISLNQYLKVKYDHIENTKILDTVTSPVAVESENSRRHQK